MAKMQITLNPSDVMAALTAWVQNPANFNPQVTHQVNATVTPVFNSDGSAVLQLNY
jgi:hypothetical protein